MIKTIKEGKLPIKAELDIEITTPGVKEQKKKKVDEMKGIDASLIFNRTGVSDREFMGTLNDAVPDPSSCITLKPGVNLQSQGMMLQGPQPERENRMTLDEYYIYCQNNEGDKVRYNKTQDKHSERTISEKDEISTQNADIDYLAVPNNKLIKSQFTKKRPMTGVKDKNKVIGDINKIRFLQNSIVDKKVNFNSVKSESSFHTNIQRGSTRNDIGLSRIKPVNPALKAIAKKRGVRPQTAKNYYTQNIEKIKSEKENQMVHRYLDRQAQKHIKEAVIQYNNIDKQGKDYLSFFRT